MILSPAIFLFNVDGGRCEECQGEGSIKVEMQFMADVHLECESCKGMRFKDEVLEVRYLNKNIYDILELRVEEAIDFFSNGKGNTEKRIVEKLKPLLDVGLGYVKLGQSSSTLSGGESQRVKLAYFLSHQNTSDSRMFIFDEPTTGLHFHDINKLMDSFNALIKKGHTILIIEHNLEIIKSADWIIDLGPEGGEKGGEIVFEGTPEELMKCKKSYTGHFLAQKIEKSHKPKETK
jgi:excinuclease ABC subunit A